MTFFLLAVLSLVILFAGAVGAWFYLSFLRLTSAELAPGVYALYGGGGNSLVVSSGNEVLLFDTKFPPFSHLLRNWIARKIGSPVTIVVNSHYHFDHTQGNVLYPQAQLFAQREAPELMLSNDQDWWKNNRSGIPHEPNLIDGTRTLMAGEQEVILTSATGHTHGDLWLYLPGLGIVATGDLFSHNYYPFFDTASGGASIPGIIETLRSMAERYPEAIFLPGHGPAGTVFDLSLYSDYLESLYDAVSRSLSDGLLEETAVRGIDLARWRLSILPIFHYGLTWLTARTNIRSAYRLLRDSM